MVVDFKKDEIDDYFDNYFDFKYSLQDLFWREVDLVEEQTIRNPDFRKNVKDETLLYKLFIEHPELNASAIARRMGISQSLFAQYISGIKKPSEKRLNEILATLRDVRTELASISIEDYKHALETA